MALFTLESLTKEPAAVLLSQLEQENTDQRREEDGQFDASRGLAPFRCAVNVVSHDGRLMTLTEGSVAAHNRKGE
jgi:hypothetical protein